MATMNCELFYVVEWVLENQFSIISGRSIVQPVKDSHAENDEVRARWGRGRAVYPARIVKVSDDQGQLTEELNNIIEAEMSKKTVEPAIVPEIHEDQDQAAKPKDQETAPPKTKPKEKPAKRQKEDLEKAAANLELLELALEKARYEVPTPAYSSTPEKNSLATEITPKRTCVDLDERTPTKLKSITPRRSPRSPRLLSPCQRPSTSSDSEASQTSTILKSAFTTLNSSSREVDFERPERPASLSLYDTNIERRVSALENWMFTMQQEVHQQRTYINWIYNEQQKNPSSRHCPTNGIGNQEQQDQLTSLISQETEFSKGAKILFKKMFSKEETAGRSLTGQRSNNSRAAKPAIENQEKLALLYDEVRGKVAICYKGHDQKWEIS
ncbi:uncharacterized protein [Argopecten irradians]|uniref:uncharacterized protein n=1 Tax=Argopecten irradians TaxID=31199 RepID=UPI00371BBAA5